MNVGRLPRWIRLGGVILVALVGVYLSVRWWQPALRVTSVRNTCGPGAMGPFAGSDTLLVAGARDRGAPSSTRHRLATMDLTQPGFVRWLADISFESQVSEIALAGDYAYVVSKGLHVVDVSAPARPSVRSTFDWEVPTLGPPRDDPVMFSSMSFPTNGIEVQQDVLVVNLGERSLEFIDVSNPDEPTWLGRHRLPRSWSAQGLVLMDQYAYTMASGLRVIDFSDPMRPVEVAVIEAPPGSEVSQAMAIDRDASLIYVVNQGLFVFDVASPTQPRFVAKAEPTSFWTAGLGTPFEQTTYRDLALTPDLALVLTFGGMFGRMKLLAFDRRNPRQPRRIGRPIMDTGFYLSAHDRDVFVSRLYSPRGANPGGPCVASPSVLRLTIAQHGW